MRSALIAHRGYPALYPENSLVSLAAALRTGAPAMEFDVQLSSDGQPLLFHDSDLKRVTGFEGRLADLNSDELSVLAAGEAERFGDRFMDVGIARLDEAAALIARWPDVRAFVEIKHESFERFEREEVLAVVTESLGSVLSRCTIISFDEDLVELCRRAGTPSGLILRGVDAAARSRAESLAPDWVFVNRRRLPDGDFRPWPGTWRWATYTVNNLVDLKRMLDAGFDGVETDCIGDLLAELDEGK